MKNNLLQRIKAGKEWLIQNRLEWLDFHGQANCYDFHRWVNNWNLYLDLFDEAYKEGLVEGEWQGLFNSWGIEDLFPELHKIFPEHRFKDHLDTLS